METRYQLVSLCEYTTRSRLYFFRFTPIASPQLPGCQMEWLRLFVDFLLPACYSLSTGDLPESFELRSLFCSNLRTCCICAPAEKGVKPRTHLIVVSSMKCSH